MPKRWNVSSKRYIAKIKKNSRIVKFCYALLHSYLQLRGSAQAAGSSPVGTHGPPDDAGFSHVNDLYKTALDDNEVIPYIYRCHGKFGGNSNLYSSLVVYLHYRQIKIRQ